MENKKLHFADENLEKGTLDRIKTLLLFIKKA